MRTKNKLHSVLQVTKRLVKVPAQEYYICVITVYNSNSTQKKITYGLAAKAYNLWNLS